MVQFSGSTPGPPSVISAYAMNLRTNGFLYAKQGVQIDGPPIHELRKGEGFKSRILH